MHSPTHPSKLAAMVAVVASAAGLSALAGAAHAQISGTTGGDVVAPHPVVFQWGIDKDLTILVNDLDPGRPRSAG
jgi:hypothetical protein